MLIFITQGRYTREAISGMVSAPEDRTEALRELVLAARGRLIEWYMTFGEYDFLCICEFPDENAAAGVLLAAAAGGGVTGLTTRLALKGPQAKSAFADAGRMVGSFRSAGSSSEEVDELRV